VPKRLHAFIALTENNFFGIMLKTITKLKQKHAQIKNDQEIETKTYTHRKLKHHGSSRDFDFFGVRITSQLVERS